MVAVLGGDLAVMGKRMKAFGDEGDVGKGL